MEVLTALKTLLCAYPQWGDQPLDTNRLDHSPQACGLFPLGLQVRRRREDVQGNVVLQLRESFLLRRAACAEEAGAQWLMALEHWLLHQTLGDVGEQVRITPTGGRLVTGKQPGTGIYELKIHVDYEKE